MMEITPDQERIFCEGLQDMAKRLIASNNIVLALAKLNPEWMPPQVADLIWKARRYAIKSMTTTVGVRKMAREKWGIALIENEEVRGGTDA